MDKARTIGLLAAAILACGGISHAAAVNVYWDGGPDATPSPDSGGSFNTNTNWAGDTLPGTGDVAALGNVSSGNRVITVDSPITVDEVSEAQTTVGPTNTLTLNATLTDSNTGGTTFGQAANFSGGTDKVVLNLNSQTLSFSNAGSTMKFYNTVNFNGDNSTIDNPRVYSGGAATYNATNFNFYGPVTVTGAAYLKQDFSGDYSDNKGALSVNNAGSLVIASGSLSILKDAKLGGTASDDDTGLNNTGSVTLALGTALIVSDETPSGSGGSAPADVYNSGTGATFSQAGSITLLSRGSSSSGSYAGITNSGTWTISGSNASISRNSNVATTSLTATFANSGTLQGNSTADTVTYNSLLTGFTDERLAMTNTGIIAPGAGTAQSGLNSVGDLTLVGTDLTFGSGGTLNLDLGGTATGQYDVLNLTAGTNNAAGTLDLSTTGDTLAVDLVNGFTPTSDFSIPILSYGAINGMFDSVTVNGAADPAYSVVYNSLGATLNYNTTAAPEPSSLTLLAASALGLMAGRKRRAGAM